MNQIHPLSEKLFPSETLERTRMLSNNFLIIVLTPTRSHACNRKSFCVTYLINACFFQVIHDVHWKPPAHLDTFLLPMPLDNHCSYASINWRECIENFQIELSGTALGASNMFFLIWPSRDDSGLGRHSLYSFFLFLHQKSTI